MNQETEQILANAKKALDDGKITKEQYYEVVLICFKAEAEHDNL